MNRQIKRGFNKSVKTKYSTSGKQPDMSYTLFWTSHFAFSPIYQKAFATDNPIRNGFLSVF